jgi:hypothetical protein
MERSEPVRWLMRAGVALIVASPLAWLVYQRPEGGYGRWGEAGLYVLAAATAAAALALSEAAIGLVGAARRPCLSGGDRPPLNLWFQSGHELYCFPPKLRDALREAPSLDNGGLDMAVQILDSCEEGYRLRGEAGVSTEETSALRDRLAAIEVAVRNLCKAAGLPYEEVTPTQPKSGPKDT